jgi:hypothetical protein
LWIQQDEGFAIPVGILGSLTKVIIHSGCQHGPIQVVKFITMFLRNCPSYKKVENNSFSSCHHMFLSNTYNLVHMDAKDMYVVSQLT